MNTVDNRIAELVSRYRTPDACLGALLCDDHPADDIAFTVIDADMSHTDLTYGELQEKSVRVASALAGLGVGPGDCVGVLMGKSADLVVALIAIWRLGAVHVPLFTAFAAPAIAMRLEASEAKLVIVDADQRAKLEPSPDMPENPGWQVVTVGGTVREGDHAFDDLLATEPTNLAPAVVGGDAPFIMIFTSGTTGAPKGVPIPVWGLAHMVAYLEYGLDVRPDDVYWNGADPGWAYGLYYAIVAPLAAGRRSHLLHAGFTPDLTWAVLSTFGVTNYAAAPTVYRALRGATTAGGVALRCASSAGEPLTPDLIPWAEATLGSPIRDHYGQTEIGMVLVNGWHPDISEPIQPGSMGRPLPGHVVEVLFDDADEAAPADTLGRVAVDRTAPLMAFPGYHHDPAKTAERVTSDGRWYLTGDTAMKDSQGRLYFSSRDDDVIIMAGYRIGPFDVESVLAQHEAVAESAVIGVPDELRGEVIEAYVVTRPGVTPSDDVTSELQQLVKTRFAAHAYPRTVHYVDSLPKTPSGKIQRYLLRAHRRAQQANGQPRGWSAGFRAGSPTRPRGPDPQPQRHE